MPLEGVRVVTFDVFGTAVDWRTGVARAVAAAADRRGAALDEWVFADAWRDRYLPSLREVRTGRRQWANLDRLHRESLDDLLEQFGVADAFDERDRAELVRSWHRLPAWEDVRPGLQRLRADRTVLPLSNGGYALLTALAKHAALPVDGVLSAELAGTYKPDRHVYETAVRFAGRAAGRSTAGRRARLGRRGRAGRRAAHGVPGTPAGEGPARPPGPRRRRHQRPRGHRIHRAARPPRAPHRALIAADARTRGELIGAPRVRNTAPTGRLVRTCPAPPVRADHPRSAAPARALGRDVSLSLFLSGGDRAPVRGGRWITGHP